MLKGMIRKCTLLAVLLGLAAVADGHAGEKSQMEDIDESTIKLHRIANDPLVEDVAGAKVRAHCSYYHAFPYSCIGEGAAAQLPPYYCSITRHDTPTHARGRVHLCRLLSRQCS